MKLPAAMRQTMRWIMRNQQTTYQGLEKVHRDLPDGKRITKAELDESLLALSDAGWLIAEMQGTTTIYRANFGQRAGLGSSRRAQTTSHSQGSLLEQIRAWLRLRRQGNR